MHSWQVAFWWLLLAASAAVAQPARFLVRPYEAFEGDSMTFRFLPEGSSVPLSTIRSWRWDFDGDGNWDEVRTVGVNGVTAEGIQAAAWIARFDASRDGDRDGAVSYRPRLEVTVLNGNDTLETLPVQDGVTEDVYGVGGGPDPEIIVKRRSIASNVLRVDFAASPRLTEVNTPVRFYAEAGFLNGNVGTLSYEWDFNGDGAADSTEIEPVFPFPAVGEYRVRLKVLYTITGGPAYSATGVNTGTLTEVKDRFVQVVNTPDSLKFGRAYRRGFPELYGWEDILKAYSARGAGNNTYVYFNHFEQALFEQQNALAANPGEPELSQLRDRVAETVNELLQGQNLLASQRLIDALRIKYPRMATYDPANPPPRLPVPPGAREETAAIDVALLDFQAPLHYAADAVARYGPAILRSRAAPGNEPYPEFPLYVQFSDPSLSGSPIPIKNEYWQLTTALDRLALGRVEKAKKLYRLSAQDATARPEAKEEAKVAGIQGYLGMALLAAGQSEADFAANQGNSLLAHVKNARDLFERINAGLNPLGNDGSFIPNESFAATLRDAQEAVADARAAEVNARQEERTMDHYEADLRNEQQRQRDSYITPLRLLTGHDPGAYNYLRTADDQRDFRKVVNDRVAALLRDYPNANARDVGEIGDAVIGVLDAGSGVEQSRNNITNLLKRVDLARWRNAELNATIDSATRRLQGLDVMYGLAQALLHDVQGVSFSTMNWVGAGIVAAVETSKKSIQAAQSIAMNDVGLQAEVGGMLIEMGNLGIAVDRANNQLRQAQLRLDNQLTRMDRLIEDLANARDTAAPLYFSDPSFRIVVSDALRRAETELDYAVDRLFRLAKTLEYEWTEPYRNPLIVPVNSQEPAALESRLFDQFTTVDSLFFIRGADEAKDYLDALEAWDSKLRRINVVSVRGPNHSGPISAEPISVREQMLNFRPDNSRGYTLDETVTDFRNFLETRRVPTVYNPANPSLEIELQTTIEDNRFFPATGSRWNMRVDSISAEIFAESGFNTSQVAEIDLIQTGVVSVRRYFAEPPAADDVMKLTFNADNLNRTAFAVAFPAKINGASGNRPQGEFINYGLKGRPVAATKWILRINTENPANRNIDFSKIKDIVLRFTYTYGNPPEFPNF